MRKLIHESRELWVGVHQKLGTVIYDPSVQQGLPSSEVRLFKVSDRSAGTFSKALLKERLLPVDSGAVEAASQAIADYARMMKDRRVTHCFQCRAHLDSVDFSVCPNCHWIKCQCGACGCNYAGRSAIDA